MAPRRPLLRYHGGKWNLAPWIISHFPPHRVYVEPYGGGGSVLLRKQRAYAEVYNDLEGELVNVFRVVRDHGERFVELLRLTPFARAEFDLAYVASEDDPLERARRFVIRSFQGFGGNITRRVSSGGFQRTGFRANNNNAGTSPARDWVNLPAAVEAIIERLRGVAR